MHAVNNAKQICIHYSASSNLIFDYYSPWGPETNELCLEGIGPYFGELWGFENCDFGVLWPLLSRKIEFGFLIFYTLHISGRPD